MNRFLHNYYTVGAVKHNITMYYILFLSNESVNPDVQIEITHTHHIHTMIRISNIRVSYQICWSTEIASLPLATNTLNIKINN